MSKVRDNLATIVAALIVGAAIIASVVLFGPWNTAYDAALVAVIHDGDGQEHRLPLSADTTLQVTTSLGTNRIVVEQGAARIAQADCPNGDCMRQQAISQPGQQLICLPHKLWVEVVTDGEDESGSMDVDSVTWDDAEDADGSAVDLVAR